MVTSGRVGLMEDFMAGPTVQKLPLRGTPWPRCVPTTQCGDVLPTGSPVGRWWSFPPLTPGGQPAPSAHDLMKCGARPLSEK